MAAWLVAGCAHVAPRAAADAEPAWILPDGALGTQVLFRVAAPGSAVGGARLVLVLASRERYRLRAADALGRGLWGLEVAPEGWLLADTRGERYCRGAERPAVPEVDLGVLPADALPAVLLGYLPVPPPMEAASGTHLDWRDPAGRRWTARSEAGRVAAWTLWDGERPLLWWTRGGEGGILSHRDGAQLRWQEVAREPASGAVGAVGAPAGYRETSCDELHLPELRQDQSPPAGGGPARGWLPRAPDRLPDGGPP